MLLARELISIVLLGTTTRLRFYFRSVPFRSVPFHSFFNYIVAGFILVLWSWFVLYTIVCHGLDSLIGHQNLIVPHWSIVRTVPAM